jgi:hypothetical protein
MTRVKPLRWKKPGREVCFPRKTAQDPKAGTKVQRHIGTKKERDKGTKEQRDKTI